MQLTAEAREGLDEEVFAYINNLESRNEQLLEGLRIALYRKFGRSSEIDRVEPQLFDESETESAETKEPLESESEETVEVAAHTMKKPGRKPIDEGLPRVEQPLGVGLQELAPNHGKLPALRALVVSVAAKEKAKQDFVRYESRKRT